MNSNREFVKQLYANLQPEEKIAVDSAVDRIVEAKRKKVEQKLKVLKSQ